jgi:uncharacterized protein (UPF0264 family)
MTLPHPRRLLVSVQNVEEARSAHLGGASIIDIKDPRRGSLGMADLEQIEQIQRVIPANVPVTAALGELREPDASPALKRLVSGLWLVKLGTSQAAHLTNAFDLFRRWCDSLGPIHRLIPAVYADRHRCGGISWQTGLQWAQETQAPVLLIDTFHKDGKRLTDWIDSAEREEIAHACRESQILLAWAGSLSKSDIEHLEPTSGDIIAVRTAACEDGNRTSPVSSRHVALLAEILARPSLSTIPEKE